MSVPQLRKPIIWQIKLQRNIQTSMRLGITSIRLPSTSLPRCEENYADFVQRPSVYV